MSQNNSGSVIYRLHRAIEFHKFLTAIDKVVPAELDIDIVDAFLTWDTSPPGHLPDMPPATRNASC